MSKKVTVVFHHPCWDESTRKVSQTYTIDVVCFRKMLNELQSSKIKETTKIEEDETWHFHLSEFPCCQMTFILRDVAQNAVAILEKKETQSEIQEYCRSQHLEEQFDLESDFLGIPFDEQYPCDCSEG